jgi:hypothetical protein
METVWRFLSNPKKCVPSPEAVGSWRDYPMFRDQSDQDVAIAVLFYFACAYASRKLSTQTTADFAKERQPYLQSAKRLHEEAQLLRARWSKDSEAEVHAAAIEAAVNYPMNKTQEHFAPMPRLVDRDQGDRYLRAYAVYLTRMASWLFNRPMHDTIATLTNVALLENEIELVSKFKVRDWSKAAVRVRDRFLKHEFSFPK